MWHYIVIGGDGAANRVDAVGIYSSMAEAEKAAYEAGGKITDGQWFGCSISAIKVDAPMRRPWFLETFNGWRNIKKAS